LFLPLVGLSLFIGVVFAWAWDVLRGFQRFLAPAVVVAMFAGLLWVCSASIRADVRDHRWLGGSANVAVNSLNDLKRQHPELPQETTLYFDDNEEPLAWDQSFGGLIKMAYHRDDLGTLYASSGESLPTDPAVRSNAIVLRYHGGRLSDETTTFRKDASPYVPYKDPDRFALTLSRNEVVAGRDSFSVQITRAPDGVAKIAYTLNDGPIETFETRLDHDGRSNFEVGASTRKGLYRFIGFNIQPGADWIRCSATVLVK
jgi:hypothetical protein